jgi:DNA-binding MurR/RpiR family transcriptional regulator
MTRGRKPERTFDERVAAVLPSLSKAEAHVAKTFVRRKRAVVLSSALQIAELSNSSDATVVRTARSLGYESLAALREALLTDLMAMSPGDRLAQTLDESGKDVAGPLHHVIGLHEETLAVLKTRDMAKRLERASRILANAERRHVFGIGPSGALALYAALQFNRLGFATTALTVPGIGLADGLVGLGRRDAVLMMAYGPLYREAEVMLDEAERQQLPIVLISDDLGLVAGDRIAELLPVPRGRANHLAMHSGTLVLIEAMTLSLAGLFAERSLDTLDRFSSIRADIDKGWARRGTRKSSGAKKR